MKCIRLYTSVCLSVSVMTNLQTHGRIMVVCASRDAQEIETPIKVTGSQPKLSHKAG